MTGIRKRTLIQKEECLAHSFSRQIFIELCVFSVEVGAEQAVVSVTSLLGQVTGQGRAG